MQADVVVVGAGLAGLACAERLQAAGRRPLVIEAGDRPGGRVGSHRRPDGHLVDLGFQVLFTAYPTANAVLDMAALDLRAYDSGALIQADGRWQPVSNPFLHPLDLGPTLGAGIAGPGDAWGAARLTMESLFGGGAGAAGGSAAELCANTFSKPFLERFLAPFLSGIWLDRTLDVDADILRFYWRMLAQGRAALPAAGMQALPDQLARRLPADALLLDTRVAALTRDADGHATGVVLADGRQIAAEAVVIAAPHPEACRLLGEAPRLRGKPALTLYFAAPQPPITRRLIALSPDPRSPIGLVAVPSLVAPGYAPPGEHQIAVQALPTAAGPPVLDPDAARAILAGWFPAADVAAWRFLEAVAVPYGQFDQAPGTPRDRAVAGPRLFVAGEATAQSSIEGALASGVACAAAVLQALPALAAR